MLACQVTYRIWPSGRIHTSLIGKQQGPYGTTRLGIGSLLSPRLTAEPGSTLSPEMWAARAHLAPNRLILLHTAVCGGWFLTENSQYPLILYESWNILRNLLNLNLCYSEQAVWEKAYYRDLLFPPGSPSAQLQIF